MQTIQVVKNFPFPGLTTEIRSAPSHIVEQGQLREGWVFDHQGRQRRLCSVSAACSIRELSKQLRRTPRFMFH